MKQVDEYPARSRGGRPTWCVLLLWSAISVVVVAVAGGGWLAARFLRDAAVEYAAAEDHFKYGSTGGERLSGIPYWIWRALPELFADYLPGNGYASLGLLFEERADLPDPLLPIGISKRRVTGIDRVYLNCAVCHTGSVRPAPGGISRIISGMPANTFDLGAFRDFLFRAALDERFTPAHFIATFDRMGARLDWIDRWLVYPLAVHLMREQLLFFRARLELLAGQPRWGPGRVDTFNPLKAFFNFPMRAAPAEQLIGSTDFPSIWNQGAREGMQLHWDGNNTSLRERNRSAALGTGAMPPTLDRESVARVEQWLLTLPPPPYPFAIDPVLAARGAELYREYCARCHGRDGQQFRLGDGRVGTVTPLAAVGTDRHRLDSYTYELAQNQNLLYAGYGDERFSHFRKTNGYANQPLDGLWLRGPYLHNGSVPSLRDLLEPSPRRPVGFYRGDDVFDPQRVGFRSTVGADHDRRFVWLDTRLPGNANVGHEGRAYGTELPDADKDALLEYLKTF